jgi:hypothetical protein
MNHYKEWDFVKKNEIGAEKSAFFFKKKYFVVAKLITKFATETWYDFLIIVNL